MFQLWLQIECVNAILMMDNSIHCMDFKNVSGAKSIDSLSPE